ncbi:DUF899 family protein [bacterium AH-315-F18]|nr:DUF899 family protein [bacterium AH-315-F18]
MTPRSKEELHAEMEKLYHAINDMQGQLTALKKETAQGDVEDYSLLDANGAPVNLSALFGDRDDLIVIQNMGASCPYCTLWADGFIGLLPHMENRASVVLVSPDLPENQQAFAKNRTWPFRMISSYESKFKRDLGFESADGSQMPGVSMFHRSGETIRNVANDFFGPGDNYCGVWHLFELLENGANEWQPQFKY